MTATKLVRNTPPRGTRWIMSRRDLPNARVPMGYSIQGADGKARASVIQKTYRQVLEALRRGPIYCASPVRLSDVVFVLKNEHGVDIETQFFDGDEEGQRFGVYFLRSRVIPQSEARREVAA